MEKQNLIQYRYAFEELFFKYLKGQIEIDTFEMKMNEIQLDVQIEADAEIDADQYSFVKQLWFKFFKGDTGATDIQELINDLNSSVNREYRLEQMRACIDLNAGLNGTELYIHFS